MLFDPRDYHAWLVSKSFMRIKFIIRFNLEPAGVFVLPAQSDAERDIGETAQKHHRYAHKERLRLRVHWYVALRYS